MITVRNWKLARLTWLGTLHIIWWTLTLASIVVSLYSHGLGFGIYEIPCEGGGCVSFFQMTSEQMDQLSYIGLSPGLYGALTIILLAIQNLSSWAIGFLLYRYGWKDPYCITASILLIVTGTIFSTDEALFGSYPWLTTLFLILNFLGSTYIFFLLLFPYGRFVPRWTLVPAVIWVIEIVMGITMPENPYQFLSWPPWAQIVYMNGMHLTVILVQILHYRQETSTERKRQFRWLLVSMSCYIIAGALGMLEIFNTDGILKALAQVALYTGLLFIPFSIGIMVLEHRLCKIAHAFNRTLVYAVLSTMSVMAYALLVGVLGLLFQDQVSAVVSLLATGLVAVLFHPLRMKAQTAVNHLVYGERDNPYQLMSELTRRLEGALTHQSLLPAIVETTAHALRIPYVAIEVQTEKGPESLAVYGAPGEMNSSVPLVVQGELIGQLILGIVQLQEAWPQGKQAKLDDLIRQVSIAVQSVRLVNELHQSRERIVIAREEERRRLRRDLHDGLGSSLASMMLRLDEAVQMHDQAPHDSKRAVQHVQSQMRTTIEDIRQLVYRLRPPILDELGLGFALQELAVQFQDRTLQITLEGVDQTFELPAATELAVYRIVQEALANVVRHAKASRCFIYLSKGSHGVHLIIQDNGTGLIQSGAPSTGLGIRSMRERAEELGGKCTINNQSGGRGTRIEVRIPITGGVSA